MPLPPDMQHADPKDPYSSLSDVHYNAPTTLFGNFVSMLQNNVIKLMSDKAEADPNIPMLQYFSYVPQVEDKLKEISARKPATPDEIEAAERDRPGFKAPLGVTPTVLNMMTNNWDNQAYWNFKASNPETSWGSIAGFAGGIAGGALDVPAVGGANVASAGLKRVVGPYAKSLMERLAVSEVAGAQAANVATKIGYDALHGGVALGAFQGTEELADESRRASFNQPTDWLGALQRVGHSAGQGALLFGAGSALGIGLFGYERPILAKPEGVKEGEAFTPENVGTEKVGGLLRSDAFQELPEKTKALIGKVYKPWSTTADTIAREEAIGQGLNGVEPDVSLALKQGAIDEGETFRDTLSQNGVDLTDLDMRLLEADEEANLKLKQLADTVEELKLSDKKLNFEKDIILDADRDVSQQALIDTIKKIDRESTQSIPENVSRYLEVQEEIKNLETKINTDGENEVDARRLEKLKSRLPKLETPREELTNIKKRLLDKGLPENFRDTLDYKRLTDLAEVSPKASQLLDRLHLEHDLKMQLKDLTGRKVVIDSMRNHINGTHPSISPNEVTNYAKRNNSIGLDPIDYDLPDAVDTTYEKELNQFAESEMQEMLSKIDLPEVKEEMEATVKRREALPTLKQMAKQLVDCILRNEV